MFFNKHDSKSDGGGILTSYSVDNITIIYMLIYTANSGLYKDQKGLLLRHT